MPDLARGTEEELASMAPLWELALSRGVSRAELRAKLGGPTFVETDSHRTCGGDEDWWLYRDGNKGAAVCLRVPYQDVVLLASEPSPELLSKLSSLIRPFPVEPYQQPLQRR